MTSRNKHDEVIGTTRVHRGRRIEVSLDERYRYVWVDGKRTGYGKLDDGFYLSAYAYDRAPSLDEVIDRYVEHLDLAVAEQER